MTPNTSTHQKFTKKMELTIIAHAALGANTAAGLCWRDFQLRH
jgi:hypothetical protein